MSAAEGNKHLGDDRSSPSNASKSPSFELLPQLSSRFSETLSSGARRVAAAELENAKDTQFGGCRSLPFTLSLYLVFSITQYAHRDVDLSMQDSFTETLRSAISSGSNPCSDEARLLSESDNSRYLLAASSKAQVPKSTKVELSEAWLGGKSLDSVRALSDILDWFERTLVRWLWVDNAHGRGAILGFNQVIGGARIQQKRLGSSACPGLEVLNANATNCFAGHGGDSKAKLGELGEKGVAGFTADKNGLYTYWFDISQTQCDNIRHSQALINERWIRPGVDSVKVESLLYNANVAKLILLEVIFDIDVSGTITPKISVKSLPTIVYKRTWLVIGDIFFVVLLFGFAVAEIRSIVVELKKGERCLQWYRILNWFVFFAGVGFSAFFFNLSRELAQLADDISVVPLPPSSSDPNSEYQPVDVNAVWKSRHESMQACFDDSRRLADHLRACELSSFWYSLAIMCKFFQAFDTVPKLNDLTVTMNRAAIDLSYFMVIFVLVFFHFVLGAYFLFGQDLYDWSTLQRSANSAFQTLMGDFDFEPMYKLAPVSSTCWFWLYMLLFVLVMLNMLIAIVMDTYAVVKTENKSNHPDLIASALTTFADRVGSIPTDDPSSKSDSSSEESRDNLPGMISTIRPKGKKLRAAASGEFVKLMREVHSLSQNMSPRSRSRH